MSRFKQPGEEYHYAFKNSIAADPTPTKTIVFDQENCTAYAEVEAKVYSDVQGQETRPPLSKFEQSLSYLINGECMENQSNTPDFILAEYLSACLAAFNVATRAREKWYGRRVF